MIKRKIVKVKNAKIHPKLMAYRETMTTKPKKFFDIFKIKKIDEQKMKKDENLNAETSLKSPKLIAQIDDKIAQESVKKRNENQAVDGKTLQNKKGTQVKNKFVDKNAIKVSNLDDDDTDSVETIEIS